jgi:hypothetical protein
MHNNADPERADLVGRVTARQRFEAIQRTIADLETRSPGCTRGVTTWKLKDLPSGELVGVPASDRATPARGRLTVAEAARRTAARLK